MRRSILRCYRIVGFALAVHAPSPAHAQSTLERGRELYLASEFEAAAEVLGEALATDLSPGQRRPRPRSISHRR